MHLYLSYTWFILVSLHGPSLRVLECTRNLQITQYLDMPCSNPLRLVRFCIANKTQPCYILCKIETS